jgi:hypothetical protein
MEEHIQELTETIDFFYTKAPMESREVFKETEKKLIEFTKSEKAWEACFAILKMEGLSTNQLFFAANTLKSKMFFDFDSLKNNYPEISDKLGEELLEIIKTYCDPKYAPVVLNSLCLALSVYCIHKNYLFEIDQVLNNNIYEVKCMFLILKFMAEEVHSQSIVV